MMTIDELITRLVKLRNHNSVSGNSIVIIEGFDDTGEFIQRFIKTVDTETRCEDEDEPQGIYINLLEEEEQHGDGQ